MMRACGFVGDTKALVPRRCGPGLGQVCRRPQPVQRYAAANRRDEVGLKTAGRRWPLAIGGWVRCVRGAHTGQSRPARRTARTKA